MDEHLELIYYKLLFKYNTKYSNKINYNEILSKLDQILVSIENNSKHKNYYELIKTMTTNIIYKCCYYKANDDK